MVIVKPAIWPNARPVFPRSSSKLSEFFFWGINELCCEVSHSDVLKIAYLPRNGSSSFNRVRIIKGLYVLQWLEIVSLNSVLNASTAAEQWGTRWELKTYNKRPPI
jgi:hypothetical protein